MNKSLKIVFLDRDGVINRFPGDGKYVTRVKDFHFLPGALRAIRILSEHGYRLFVVSNQAGVGKGVYTSSKLNQINRHMLRKIKSNKGKISKVFYCTHPSNAGCECRKPEIGSIRSALRLLKKNMRHARNAYFIGDTRSDIEAGYRGGCKTIFVLSGRETRRHIARWQIKPDYIVKDILEAAKVIAHEKSYYPYRNGESSASAFLAHKNPSRKSSNN